MRPRLLFAAYGAALGVLVAWAVVILLAYGRPELYAIQVFAATGLAGGAYGTILGATSAVRGSRANEASRLRPIGRFLKFAVAGWLGHLVIVATIGSVARREFAIENWQILGFLIVFGAIGVTSGLASSRYRDVVAEREAAVRLARERERAAEELELARQLQQQLLPAKHLDGNGFRVHARVLPARYVAGDFYDYSVSADTVSFCIADVAGKGAAAGLLMATTKAMLSMLRDHTDPAAALTTLNEKLCGRLVARQFVALLYGVFSPATGHVALANAGMPDPLRIRTSGQITAIEAAGERLPLGLRRHSGYQTVETLLEPGDRLVCFSDGLPEASVGDGEMLGYEGLQSVFASSASLNEEELIDTILARISNHTDNELGDDCTLLIISRCSYA
jgi:serine phosphatase RsbU (regulator of sigma subunit)